MANLTPGLWYRTDFDNPHDAHPVFDVRKLAEALPHGSGIDGSWAIMVRRNGDLCIHGEFHQMDGNGMYDGWVNFRFIIAKWRKPNLLHPLHPLWFCDECGSSFYHREQPRSCPYCYKVWVGSHKEQLYQVQKVRGGVYLDRFIGGGREREYLYDVISHALAEIGIHSMHSGPAVTEEQARRITL